MRWRLLFAFLNDSNDFDPDYEVKKDNKKPAPQLPSYLKLGLLEGRRFVHETIAKIPQEEEKDLYSLLNPNRHHIGKFLVDNDYIVTNTDKNLGIAVSKREWIEEKTLQILEDRDNYGPLDSLTATRIMDKQCELALELSENADCLASGKQLSEFLRSKVTPGDWKRKTKDSVRRYVASQPHWVPGFHRIPKIHSTPVKFRPIAPCYNAIQNPAAKFVSKQLKPLIKAAPTLIQGSKDLAIKLSTLDLSRTRKLWIVTGDVVAFYPNIPTIQCLDIVVELYNEYTNSLRGTDRGDGTLHDDYDINMYQKMFKQAIHLANKDLIVQFKDKLYRQKKGLAMGVACSPDLANLFGWYFERKCNILNRPNIPFYRRFIDDCLAFVYAPTLPEAISELENSVQFDGCTIKWAGGRSMPFLDMTLYIDRYGDVEHMPYRKSRSHQERIPWISHHPLDVKCCPMSVLTYFPVSSIRLWDGSVFSYYHQVDPSKSRLEHGN